MTSSYGTKVCVTLAGLLLVPAVRADDRDTKAETIPVVLGHGLPLGIVRGHHPDDPAIGECYEVYAESLKEIPLILEVAIGVHNKQVAIPLRAGEAHWYNFLRISSDPDSKSEVQIHVRPGTERITLAERQARWDFRLSGQIPAVLQPQDGASTLARIADTSGDSLVPGFYHIIGSFLPGAEEFFGVKAVMTTEFYLTVKDREPGDDNAFTEERIERHYLLGSQLRFRDKQESTRVLERGLGLVKRYIADGAGEEDGTYNLSPRFQAAAILARLDRKREAITYLQRALSKGAGSENCVWQPYHFGLTTDGKCHGKLPFTASDRIYRRLSRLYLEEYGRRLNADKPSSEE